MSSRDRELSEEFRLLYMLHNIGATTSEKSLSIPEVAEWTALETSVVGVCLQKLKDSGYVELKEVGGVEKYHLTLNGIRKVLSLYS